MIVAHFGLGVVPIPSLDRAAGMEHDVMCLTDALVRLGCETWIVDIPAPPAARTGMLARFLEIPTPILVGREVMSGLPASVAFGLVAALRLNWFGPHLNL